MKFDEIIKNGLDAGKSYDEINAELKDAGATFHLEAEKAGKGWTEEEMREGFIPADEPAKPVQKKVDMSRRPEFAGTTQEQVVLGITWKVAYDIDGYATRAVKAK